MRATKTELKPAQKKPSLAKPIAQKKIPWILVIIFMLTGAVITVLVRQARKKLKENEGGNARI